MAKVIQSDLKSYQYDAMYDIAKVVRMHKEKRANTTSQQSDEMHLFTRSTGCDLVSPNCESYETRKANNSKCYKLKFVWNCDYFNRVPFCTVLN